MSCTVPAGRAGGVTSAAEIEKGTAVRSPSPFSEVSSWPPPHPTTSYYPTTISSVAVLCTSTEYHFVRGLLPSSPSNPDFKVQVDAMARTPNLPSSTSWDACYIEKASTDELRSWLPADTVDTIPAETQVFRISRDEDPIARAKKRKMVLKETRATYIHCSSLNLA